MSKNYSNQEIAEIRLSIINKIEKEIDVAIQANTLEFLISKYEIYKPSKNLMLIDANHCKVLVVGQLSGRKKDYIQRIKKQNIDPKRFEFLDYNEFKKFNVVKLKNSMLYSDVIYGPCPHSVKGMSDVSSFLEEMIENPDIYPNLIIAKDNSNSNSLKFSITCFDECIKKTRLYLECI